MLNANYLLKRIANQKLKADCVELFRLQKQYSDLKLEPAKTVRLAVKHNERGFTRFNHKPDTMIVTMRSKERLKGHINIDGQMWDWGVSFRTPNPDIQKVVAVSPTALIDIN